MSKVVLVTGASSGIGLSIAGHLAQRGYKVWGGSRSAPPAGHFESVKLDVADDDSVMAVVREIIEKEGRIDAVVNNAGVGSVGAIEKTPVEDVRRLFEVNVYGPVRVCQAVLPSMRKQQSGHIINVSSMGSMLGMPFRGYYSASKAALDLITETLRMEVERFGIKACTVHPGDVRTGIADHRIVSGDMKDADYGKTLKKVYENMNAGVDKGISPDRFGPVIEKILRSKNVKRSYYVGKPIEVLGVKLKNYLPSRWYEALLRKYFDA